MVMPPVSTLLGNRTTRFSSDKESTKHG